MVQKSASPIHSAGLLAVPSPSWPAPMVWPPANARSMTHRSPLSTTLRHATLLIGAVVAKSPRWALGALPSTAYCYVPGSGHIGGRHGKGGSHTADQLSRLLLKNQQQSGIAAHGYTFPSRRKHGSGAQRRVARQRSTRSGEGPSMGPFPESHSIGAAARWRRKNCKVFAISSSDARDSRACNIATRTPCIRAWLDAQILDAHMAGWAEVREPVPVLQGSQGARCLLHAEEEPGPVQGPGPPPKSGSMAQPRQCPRRPGTHP